MPVFVIDTIKPKNNGSFPVVEAIDVSVEGYSSLAEAVANFATLDLIDDINDTLSGKANSSDVETATANLQGQIDQIVISASAESVVAPEVAAARVGADGETYATLKARLDAESNSLRKNIDYNKSEISDLKSVTDGLLAVLPDDYVSVSHGTNVDFPTSLGNCNGSGVIDTTNTARAHTDYIPISDYYSIGLSSNTKSTMAFWVRCFSDDHVFVGSISEAAQSEDVLSADILHLFPTAKYVIIAVKKINDGSMVGADAGVVGDRYKKSIVDGKSLDETFASTDDLSAIDSKADTAISKADGAIAKSESIISIIPSGCINETYSDVSLSTELGNCNSSGVIDTTNTARAHTDYIKISDYNSIEIAEGFSYWVRCFSDTDTFVGSVSDSPTTGKTTMARILTAQPTAEYIVLAIKKTNDETMVGADPGVVGEKIIRSIAPNASLDDVYVSKYKKEYVAQDIRVQYPIDNDGHYTKGWLKLPINYSPNGRPVPLIVFVHGSADFPTIDSNITDLYQEYYDYLVACGYALFDCYGWGTKFTAITGGATNTWGTPINRKCYSEGIKHVCKEYNISEDNVFVACKSLGGVQALSMFYDESIKINAIGMLAPLLNPFEVYLGYDLTTRRAVTSDIGFSEDVDGVLDFADTPSPEYWDYVTANMQAWSGVVSYFSGLNIASSDKPDYYTNKAAFLNLFRASLNRPIKIWIAEDDSALITSATALINTLINGGNKGALRLLPAGTGGHHAVDNSPLALQTLDVTTRNNIHYDSIPTAYYELAQWFDMWQRG